MSSLTKRLKVTWKRPLHINDTLSLVLYRYKHDVIEPTCENMPTIGELVYETEIIDEGFFDDEVEVGKWHYAIYAKNKAGLSPCVIDTYEVILDADGDGVIDALDLYPFNPLRASGIDTDGDLIDDEFDPLNAAIKIDTIVTSDLEVTFTVIAIGSDIHAWRYSIDDGVVKAGNSGTVTETLTSDGQHTIKVEALDENGQPVLDDIKSFDLEKPSTISIDSLLINPLGNPEIHVSVEGTRAVYWDYQVKTLNGQIAFEMPSINLGSSSVRHNTYAGLNKGVRYQYIARVLDQNNSVLATDSDFVSVPVGGADKLWGIDIAAGEYGVPEPDESYYSGAQGAFQVLDWPSNSSSNYTISAESTVNTGFLGTAVLTDSPAIKGYYQRSAIFEEMIPEKWYNLVFSATPNSSGNSVLRLYINSILCSQAVLHAGQIANDNLDLLVGAIRQSSWDLDYAFNGKIDQVSFWARGLGVSDVEEIYNNGNGSPYSSFSPGLKTNMRTCLEFDNPSTVTTSAHAANTPGVIVNGFGHQVNRHNDGTPTDAGIMTIGAPFSNHPITQPGGKVSAHAFTPCYLPGMRDGINPSTGVEYTSSEITNFYSQSTRKVTALHINNPSASPRHIPGDHQNYSVSCWLKREGRAVGYYSSSSNIKGSNAGYLVSEYAGWSGDKNAKFLMYVDGPSYELDENTYWMYNK